MSVLLDESMETSCSKVMKIRSLFKSGALLFSLALLLVLLALSLTIFFVRQQNTSLPVRSAYPANIDFEPLESYGTYNPTALSNPNIRAVDVNMNWASVEPQQGMFNFGPADNEVAAWAKQRKKFTLIVRYIDETGIAHGTDCNIRQFLPAWEIMRIQHFCDMDRRTIIPDYFGPTFEGDLKAYVKAIADHFAISPYRNNLLYVRIGLGLGGEGFPLTPGGDYAFDKQRLESWGYTPAAWAAWQKALLTYYKSVFPYTTIIYPVNGLDTDQTTGQPVQVEVAEWAASQGMGIGQQGLRPQSNYPLFQSLRSKYPGIYIQFQTVLAINGGKDQVQGDIQAASRNGAQFIEWYSQDATNPSFQSLFAQWQQMVDSMFANT